MVFPRRDFYIKTSLSSDKDPSFSRNMADRWRPFQHVFLDVRGGDVIAIEVTRKRARRIRVTWKLDDNLENERL